MDLMLFFVFILVPFFNLRILHIHPLWFLFQQTIYPLAGILYMTHATGGIVDANSTIGLYRK